jgi:membrane-associated protease RseP (regulator of RpoE activity)
MCGSVFGQDAPRVDVFGGYSYLNVDTNGLSSRQSANGWEASVSGNFNRLFAAEADFSGYYKTIPLDLTSVGFGVVDVNVTDFSFAGGPRVNFRPAFVHALFGVDHLTGSALGVSASQDSFAAILGGGIQWKVAPQWSVRAGADYVFTHHNFVAPLESFTQNNFRVSVGVVYSFGGGREVAPHGPRKIAVPQCEGSSEAALLGVMGCGVSGGFKVTSVHSGSPAARAGITPGDIVATIDGRPVHSSNEIETAIAANTSGTIRVGYMIQGNYLTERDTKVH